MNFTLPNFGLMVPEMFVLGMACLLLVVDAFLSDEHRYFSYRIAQGTLLGALVLSWLLWDPQRVLGFDGNYVQDAMGSVLKIALLLAVSAAFLYARDYLKARGLFKGEFYVLGLLATLGMMIMISAGSLLTVYLGLELLSLSLYAMVAFDRDNANASEAAMKYFVLGALASGMLLYGMSMLYGATGTIIISEVAAGITQTGANDQILALGLVFLVVGVAFKLGAVPFHMWIPDVYHGAPTAVTMFVGSAPKIAAFAIAMRILVDGMGQMHSDWQQMLIVLSVLSMGIGNLVAIAQTNIKRMLAYSTIANVGFLLLGILSGTREGYAASMFYVITYVIMVSGAFGVVLLLSRVGFEADRLDDFKGLNRRSPWIAFLMLLVMFSTAGVPPLVGFYAKLAVLRAAIDAGLVWLAVVAVVFSIIGAFYYLRVVKLMYFDDPVSDEAIGGSTDTRIVLSANGLLLGVLGVMPGWLMGICAAAFA
jgi:NADH-quinone oxidoreductase subunit N